MIVSYTKVEDVVVYYMELYEKQSDNHYVQKLTVDLQDSFGSKFTTT